MIPAKKSGGRNFYKMMKKLIGSAIMAAAVFAVCSVLSAEAKAQGPAVAETLRRMEAHYKALSSLRADVTMSKTDNVLKETQNTLGTAIYAPRKGKDALVRIDWKSPEESLAVIDKTYYIYRPRLKQAYTGSTSKPRGGSQAAGALSFMNMSRAELRANYEITQAGENERLSDGTVTMHLKLVPKAAGNYKWAELWVDSDGMPRQSMIVETNGDTTTILLTNLRKNAKIDASEFRINLPKDTKIIKN